MPHPASNGPQYPRPGLGGLGLLACRLHTLCHGKASESKPSSEFNYDLPLAEKHWFLPAAAARSVDHNGLIQTHISSWEFHLYIFLAGARFSNSKLVT